MVWMRRTIPRSSGWRKKIRDPVVRMRGQVTDQPPVALLPKGDAQRHLFSRPASMPHRPSGVPAFPATGTRMSPARRRRRSRSPGPSGRRIRSARAARRHVRPQFQAFGQRRGVHQVIHPLRVQFQQDAVEQFLALQVQWRVAHCSGFQYSSRALPASRTGPACPRGCAGCCRSAIRPRYGSPGDGGWRGPAAAAVVRARRRGRRGDDAGERAGSRISTQRLMSCGWLIR